MEMFLSAQAGCFLKGLIPVEGGNHFYIHSTFPIVISL